MGQKSAFEMAAQLALDEARQAVAGVGSAGAREEGLEVVAQDLVQPAALGLAETPDVKLAAQQHAASRTVGRVSPSRLIPAECARCATCAAHSLPGPRHAIQTEPVTVRRQTSRVVQLESLATKSRRDTGFSARVSSKKRDAVGGLS